MWGKINKPLMHYSLIPITSSLTVIGLSLQPPPLSLSVFPRAHKSWSTLIRRWKGGEEVCEVMEMRKMMKWRQIGCGWLPQVTGLILSSLSPKIVLFFCPLLQVPRLLSSHFSFSLSSSSVFLPACCCLVLLPLPPFIYRTCMVWSSAWIISSRLLIMNESGFCGSQRVGLLQRLIN